MSDNHYITLMCVVAISETPNIAPPPPPQAPNTHSKPPMNYHSDSQSFSFGLWNGLVQLSDWPAKSENEMRKVKPIPVTKDDRKLLSTWVRKLQWKWGENAWFSVGAEGHPPKAVEWKN